MPSVAAFRGEGRWDEALSLVDDPLARADRPDVAAGLLTLGEVAVERGEPERARTGAEPFLRRIEAAQEALP